MSPLNSVVGAAMAVSAAYSRGRDSTTAKTIEVDTKLTDLLEDSLDYLEFFMFLEDEWPSAKFSDKEIAEMKDVTVSDLIDKMMAKGA